MLYFRAMNQKLNREILRLAFPNIISNISVPLAGMADLAMMGHLADTAFIGAIALGGMVFSILYMSFGFLRMGTTGFTAQAFGRNDEQEISLNLMRSLLLAAAAALFLLLLQYPIGKLAFVLTDGSPEVEKYAAQYFYIRIWAAPATISLYSFNGWFIGMQNTKYPLWISLLVNGANIGFNFLFVLGFGMKSEGVALGTLLAQYSGLMLAIILFLKHYGKYSKLFNLKKALDIDTLKNFFRVNGDIFIRTVLLILTLSFFTAQSATFGDTLLATNTLLFQYFLFFSYFIDGFAFAAEALVGKFIGAGFHDKLVKSVKLLFGWGFFLSLPFTLAYAFGGELVLKILTSNTEVISASKDYMIWVGMIPLITFPAFLLDGIYVGATASKAMRNSMIIATLLLFLPVYYLFREQMQNHALWMAFLVFMAARGLSLFVMMKKQVYEKTKR